MVSISIQIEDLKQDLKRFADFNKTTDLPMSHPLRQRQQEQFMDRINSRRNKLLGLSKGSIVEVNVLISETWKKIYYIGLSKEEVIEVIEFMDKTLLKIDRYNISKVFPARTILG
jgi:hypothetical protein